MAKAPTSKKPAPIDTPHWAKRGRQYHYRRRVPDWLQPIVGATFWWERLGSDEATARIKAAALTRRYDRLCTPEMRRLVLRDRKVGTHPLPLRLRFEPTDFDPRSDAVKGVRRPIENPMGVNRIRQMLDLIALDPLDEPTLPDDLLSLPDDQMRRALMFHRVAVDMVKANNIDREYVAPLVEALTTEPGPENLTVSEVAEQWLAKTKRGQSAGMKWSFGDLKRRSVTRP